MKREIWWERCQVAWLSEAPGGLTLLSIGLASDPLLLLDANENAPRSRPGNRNDMCPPLGIRVHRPGHRGVA